MTGLSVWGSRCDRSRSFLLMCDRHDIGLAIHGEKDGAARPDPPGSDCGDGRGDGGATRKHRPSSSTTTTRVGIGFSEPLFGLHDRLLEHTRDANRAVPVRDWGAPSCVGPIGQTGPRAKPVALALLVAIGVPDTARSPV